MKILSIELRDFGIFQKLRLNTDANLVGFAGPPGSGKTTILTAVRYGLASDLGEKSDKASSFIHNYDPAKSANVVITAVSPQGNNIEISKTIKHSSTERSLIVDGGKAITSAKGFEEAMTAIMQADASTVSRLVFTSQGALATLLGSLVSEREKLFTRVLDVDYLRAASSHLKGRIQTIKASVVDHRPTLINALEQASTLQSEINELRKIVARFGTPDPVVVRQQLENYIKWSDKMESLSYDLRSLKSDITNLEVELKSEKSSAQLTAQIEELTRKGTEALRDYTVLNARASAAGTEDRIAVLTERVQQLEERKAVLLEDMKQTETSAPKVTGLGKIAADIRNVSKASEELKVTTALLDELRAEIKASRDTHVQRLNDLRSKEALQKEIKNIRQMGFSGSTCPLCTGNTKGKHLHWEKEDEDNLSNLHKEVVTLQSVIQSEDTRYNELVERASELTATITWFEKLYSEFISSGFLPMDLVKKDPEQAVRDLEELGVTQAMHATACGILADLERSITDDKTVIESLREVGSKSNSTPLVYKTPEEAFKVGRESEEGIKVLTAIRNIVETKERTLVRLGLEQVKLLKDIESHKTTKPLLPKGIDDPKGHLDTALQNESVYTGAVNSLAFKEGMIVNFSKVITDTQKKVDNMRTQTEWLQSMDQLANKLDEASKMYVRRQFDSMVGVVLSVLETMSTNFTVRQDINTPLSFEFRPIAKDSVWHAQSKLSGGQKVRLSLAFLIAVQRALLPGIGLLVLDEPSLHLGETDKKHLADLLGNLAHTTFSGDRQIMVCDHSPTVLENCEILISTDTK